MSDEKLICRIIRESRRNGVRRLKWKELEVEFHAPRDYVLENQSGHLEQSTSVANQLPFPWANQPGYKDKTDEPPETLIRTSDLEAEKEFEEIQLAIEDPLAYEELQMATDVEAARMRGNGERAEERRSEQDLYGSGGS